MLKNIILVAFSFSYAHQPLGAPLENATTTNFTALKHENNIQKAIAWLISHRENDWGWGNHTAKVLLALQLAPAKIIKPVLLNQAEIEKSTRKLEIDTLLLLEEKHMNILELVQNSLTLVTFSQDLTDFHGHNILNKLGFHSELSRIKLAYVSLVKCSSRIYVTDYQVQQLLNTISNSHLHDIKTLALSILSLRCISENEGHSHLKFSLKNSTVNLARQQQADGSFGSLHDTALTVWALQNASEGNDYWNKSAAVLYIESKQGQDGAFLDPSSTSDAILALSSTNPWTIRHIKNCSKDAANMRESANPHYCYHGHNFGNVTVTYTVWIGTDVVENYTLELTVPRSSSFYRVMQIAAEKDAKFTFEATQWQFGHYIYTLGGHTEDHAEDIYWLLYRMSEIPHLGMAADHFIPTAVGVDGLLVDEGDHYLFWYKKL